MVAARGVPGVRGSVGNLLLQVAYATLSFATVAILARLLGASAYGAYAYGIAWAGFLGVPSTLGYDRLVVRDLAAYRANGRWGLARGLLRRSNTIVAVISLVLAGAAVATGLSVLPSALGTTFAIAMVLVPLTALTLLRQACLQAFDRPVFSQLPELLVRPLLFVAVVVAIWLSRTSLGPSGAMGINVCVSAAAFAFGAVLLSRSTPVEVRAALPSYTNRAWATAAVPMMVISGIWVVNGYVGTVMLGSIVDARAAGIYSVASRGADFVAMSMLAVNVPLAPRLARLHATGNRGELQRLVSRGAQAALLWSVPVAILLVAFRSVYLGIFGKSFAAGSTTLILLVIGQLLNVASGPVGVLMLMTGYERRAALLVGVGAIVNIVVNAALDPFIGLSGAAIGAIASVICWNASLAYCAMRRLGINPTVFVRAQRADGDR